MKSKRITVLHKGDRVKLLSNNSKWVAVEVNGRVGYTQGRYISVKNGGTASDTTVTKGESVVNYALSSSVIHTDGAEQVLLVALTALDSL